jgi:hypothetical protein
MLGAVKNICKKVFPNKKYELVEGLERQIHTEYRAALSFIEEKKSALSKFPRRQRESAIKKIGVIKKHLRDFLRFFNEKKEVQALDEFFFRFEDLPLTGKEYWWFYFAPVDNPRLQMLVTFGRGRSKAKVEGYAIERSKSKNEKECAFVGWFFDKNEHEFIREKVFVNITPKSILVDNPYFEISGEYPKLNFIIKKDGKDLCNLKLFKQNKFYSGYHCYNHFRGPFGCLVVQLDLNFVGTINNIKCKGHCILQKVMLIGPFIPWKWGQFYFKDGSSISFFKPYISFLGFNYNLESSLLYYDAKTNQSFQFKRVDVDIVGNNYPYWIIKAGSELLVLAEIYNTGYINMEKIGRFTYTGSFSLVRAFGFEKNGIQRSLDNVGSGVGILENAYGFLI